MGNLENIKIKKSPINHCGTHTYFLPTWHPIACSFFVTCFFTSNYMVSLSSSHKNLI